MLRILLVVVSLILALPTEGAAARRDKKAKKAEEAAAAAEEQSKLNAGTFAGMRFRSIGPATTSGRVIDLAVHPDKHHVYYVAMASGGVWKTTNNGTTWAPIFDGEGSYSIGCITIDPKNPHVIWVGTGENNSQRSVSYGDGVYKSVDGGKSWKNVGLKESEHIGMIKIDPRDSDVVYVAAQGPLWGPGGDRGLYKTTDGGATWNRVLEISENTGVSEVFLDPRDPDVIYASSYQRRRRVWTLINGGPESAIHKSTDGGETWAKLGGGLPSGELGRIGMAMSPVDPDVLYATIEATSDGAGFYRSVDRGATWEKRSGWVSGSPQYYQELFPDPHDVDRLYTADTLLQVTEDGGANFSMVPAGSVHVDHHAMWIDPNDADHILLGNDGGLYETWDRGGAWQFKANMPVTQFYRVNVDNDFPFYNVYGGTQDNYTLGGPSRTINAHGIDNSDWFVTLGGDGFETVIDPENPDIVYSQYQHAGIVRFDRKTGEQVDIQPQAAPGDDPLRWNWDSPLIISPHSNTRLYFGAQRVFRSDDRGDSWTPVSGDLTRNLDRNKLKVMGRVWGVDTVAKNASTSEFANLIMISESPLAEGLLYTGSDDGLIHVSEDGGGAWRKIASEDVDSKLKMTYIAEIEASRHDADTVYVAFDAHKDNDFAPYIYKSTDRGQTWAAIQGDLPERGTVYTLAEDHVDPDLLFAGTEFGVFFTVDGGEKWVRLQGGLPTIAVKDIEIQRRESDLVLATFGRSFYILDDYSPLRNLTEEMLEGDAHLFPVKDAWQFVEATPIGSAGKGFQGDSFYTAPNPPMGAVFSVYLKEGLTTRKQRRQKEEAKQLEENQDTFYPTWDELRAEDREDSPTLLLTVKDSAGKVVRRLKAPATPGLQRVTWDFRLPAPDPTSLQPFVAFVPWMSAPQGPMAPPGTYSVEVAQWADDTLTPLAGPESFKVTPLGWATLPADDRDELFAFQEKTARLWRAVLGASEVAGDASNRIAHLKQAILDTPAATMEHRERAEALHTRLLDLLLDFEGDGTIGSRYTGTPPSIMGRVAQVVYGHWSSTSNVTKTHQDSYRWAAEAFAKFLPELRRLVEDDLTTLENELEALGAPWTPGRFPNWKPE